MSDRLAILLAKERTHPLTYIGCMKKGPVITDPKMKWYVVFQIISWQFIFLWLLIYFSEICLCMLTIYQWVYNHTNFRYEKSGHLIGNEYFLHAYGPIYVLSAEVVASLAAARNNRSVNFASINFFMLLVIFFLPVIAVLHYFPRGFLHPSDKSYPL